MKNIGIICEGPTDYVLLKAVIDRIIGTDNRYMMLQPDPDLMGNYGNGWKGVLKWCRDHRDIKDAFMQDIQPALDLLVIQMDGDVSRKEKSAHCECASVNCPHKGVKNPLECDITPTGRRNCPVELPCGDHDSSANGCAEHLKGLIASWLKDTSRTCITIPCDSTDAWVVAAYDQTANVETIADPWNSIIAKKKDYHNIRISGGKKRVRIFEEFACIVCDNWNIVTQLCRCAKDFEENMHDLLL